MYKVQYQDGKDNGQWKEKIFETKIQANGFKVVSWHEYQCYNFIITEIKEEKE